MSPGQDRSHRIGEGAPGGRLRALALVREALQRAGWRVEAGADPARPLEARRGQRRLGVCFNWAREPRRDLLQGLLADALLRGQAGGGAREPALAVVGAPRFSEAMARDLDAYVARHAPGQAYGYVDARGLVRLRGGALVTAERDAEPDAPRGAGASQPRDPFSDRNQWLLKVMAGGRLPRELLSVPREPVRGAAQLAAAARVSTPAAFRLRAWLRAEGCLDEADRLVGVAGLLGRWRAAALRPQRQFGAVWALPGRDPRRRLEAALAARAGDGEPAACLGLFAACEALGLGHVKGAPWHVYVRRPDPALLESLGLVRAPGGRTPDVLVRVARWPETVFRGAVRRGGVPVADVIQCWLDVSAEPARGREQAAYLWKRLIGPEVAGGGKEPR